MWHRPQCGNVRLPTRRHRSPPHGVKAVDGCRWRSPFQLTGFTRWKINGLPSRRPQAAPAHSTAVLWGAPDVRDATRAAGGQAAFVFSNGRGFTERRVVHGGSKTTSLRFTYPKTSFHVESP